MVRLLLRLGADPSARSNYQYTPLILTAVPLEENSRDNQARRLRVVRTLIAAGAEPSERTVSGGTVLSAAAGADYERIAAFVLRHGAKVDVRDDTGRTPLIHAARFGSRHVLPVLLDAGADPTIEDDSGKTAIDYARSTDQTEIVRLLQDASR